MLFNSLEVVGESTLSKNYLKYNFHRIGTSSRSFVLEGLKSFPTSIYPSDGVFKSLDLLGMYTNVFGERREVLLDEVKSVGISLQAAVVFTRRPAPFIQVCTM